MMRPIQLPLGQNVGKRLLIVRLYSSLRDDVPRNLTDFWMKPIVIPFAARMSRASLKCLTRSVSPRECKNAAEEDPDEWEVLE